MGWVNAGQRVKVALVWNSTPTKDYTTHPVKADLDLVVSDPTQPLYSASWDNSYKVVDFTATASGNFQIKVKNYRFDGFNEFSPSPGALHNRRGYHSTNNPRLTRSTARWAVLLDACTGR